jgi:SAM-dependent methyltransferase
MPAADVLAGAYAEAESSDYIEEEAGQRATARETLARIERHASRRGALLDIGCWTGFLLAEARDRGWSVTGVEPSEFASRYAREQLGLDVRTADLFDASLPPGAFDAVVMGDVIEHVPVPADALRCTAALMRPGSVLWLALPDAGSRVAHLLAARWWSVLPTHVQYFTRGSLRVLLDRCGFDALGIATCPKAFTVRYYLQRISGYSRPTAAVLTAAARASRLEARMWAPDFRDRMGVIARRR